MAAKHIKALTLGGSYARSLREKIDDLDQNMRLLRERTTQLTNESVRRIESIVEDTERTVQVTAKVTQSTESFRYIEEHANSLFKSENWSKAESIQPIAANSRKSGNALKLKCFHFQGAEN